MPKVEQDPAKIGGTPYLDTWGLSLSVLSVFVALRLEKTYSCPLFFFFLLWGASFLGPLLYLLLLCGVPVNNIIFMFDKHIIRRMVIGSGIIMEVFCHLKGYLYVAGMKT